MNARRTLTDDQVDSVLAERLAGSRRPALTGRRFTPRPAAPTRSPAARLTPPRSECRPKRSFAKAKPRPPPGELEVRKLYWLAGEDHVLQDHARHPAIVDVIADLLDTDDIKLYADQLFMKPPAIGAAQPWHQDSKSFIDIYPMDLVTAWAAIDDSTLENGCLEFVSGSHRWGLLSNEQMDEHRSLIGSDPAFMPEPGPLRSGSVSFHHSLTWHASRANTSTARRRGYAVHYMRAESRRTAALEAPRVPPPLQIRGRSFEGCV